MSAIAFIESQVQRQKMICDKLSLNRNNLYPIDVNSYHWGTQFGVTYDSLCFLYFAFFKVLTIQCIVNLNRSQLHAKYDLRHIMQSIDDHMRSINLTALNFQHGIAPISSMINGLWYVQLILSLRTSKWVQWKDLGQSSFI